MASGRCCGSAGCGDDDGTLPPSPCASMSVESPPPSSWAVDVVDDAPTPVLEDESSEEKSPVPEKGFFHSEGKPFARDQRAEHKIIGDDELKIFGDDIDWWGYIDEEGDEEGDELGDMIAWAKLTGFKKEVDQLDFQDSNDDFYIPITTIRPKKCSLCEGDHHTLHCNYMDSIPPGTKITNTEDYVILCACGGLSEDGGKCDNIDCVSRGVSQDGGKSRPWPPRWVIPRDVL